jgi:CrcB protein
VSFTLSFYAWMLGSGLLGLVLRFSIDRWLGSAESGFPVGIFLANILGAFLAGSLAAWVSRYGPSEMVLALSYGFLGAFTTFSAFSIQSLSLLQQAQWGVFAAYFVGSPVAGLFAAAVGFVVVQRALT